MKNNLRLATDLLIVDEIHKFYGEDFIKYLDGTLVQYKFNLGLTATFRDKRMRHKKIEKDWKPFDIITQKEALEKGWISNFQEYNLGVELSDLEVKMYNQNNDIINKHLNKFLPHGMKAAMKCFIGGKDAETYKFVPAKVWCETLAAEKGYYHGMPTDSPIYKMWNPNLIFGYAKQIVTALRNVSDLMYYSEAKLAVTLQLLQKFKDKKTMIFGQSSMLADRIAEDFEKLTGERISVFHTQLKPRPMRDTQGELITYKTGKQAGEVKLFGIDSLKKLALTDFATNKTRVLSTVSALDENYDCPDIEIGVITGRTSDANKQTQRGGRIKRLIPKDPNAVMLIINLYNKMTKDYEWLRKAQDDSSHYIKWVNDIEDINFEVETEETFDLTDI
jgi:superfamily II DNA or RNA helicase